MYDISFKKQGLSISIVIFITLFLIINQIKPNIIYNIDGSLKNFGIGYKKKTVIPLWFITIIIAILSYIIASVIMK